MEDCGSVSSDTSTVNLINYCVEKMLPLPLLRDRQLPPEEYQQIWEFIQKNVSELNAMVVSSVVDNPPLSNNCKHLDVPNTSICQGIPDSFNKICMCGMFLVDDAPCGCRRGLLYSDSSTSASEPDVTDDYEPVPGPSSLHSIVKIEEDEF
ncbi:uncharacterized protein LOC127286859 [Leptopilina boulardi]|uniref:uncharacterized protein LOC127286859 n=1 Tax=Leptopilina boulardi TaxID=63433 RepID=UPI0021F5DAC7|nr:uncharacterized protein LOC127286859 [Leptopilina boulardi]